MRYFRNGIIAILVAICALVVVSVYNGTIEDRASKKRDDKLSEFAIQVDACERALRALALGRNAEDVYPIGDAMSVFAPRKEYFYNHYSSYDGDWLPRSQDKVLAEAIDGETWVHVNGTHFEIRRSLNWHEMTEESPTARHVACHGPLEGPIDTIRLVPGISTTWNMAVFDIKAPDVFVQEREIKGSGR